MSRNSGKHRGITAKLPHALKERKLTVRPHKVTPGDPAWKGHPNDPDAAKANQERVRAAWAKRHRRADKRRRQLGMETFKPSKLGR